jgi:hypothetical protein
VKREIGKLVNWLIGRSVSQKELKPVISKKFKEFWLAGLAAVQLDSFF